MDDENVVSETALPASLTLEDTDYLHEQTVARMRAEGQKVKEIADKMNLSASEVNKLLRRVKKREKEGQEDAELSEKKRAVMSAAGSFVGLEDTVATVPKPTEKIMTHAAIAAISKAAEKRAQLQTIIEESRIEDLREEVDARRKLRERARELDLEERELKISRQKAYGTPEMEEIKLKMEEVKEERINLQYELNEMKRKSEMKELMEGLMKPIVALSAEMEVLKANRQIGMTAYDLADRLVDKLSERVAPHLFREMGALREAIAGKAIVLPKLPLMPISVQQAERIAGMMEQEQEADTRENGRTIHCMACERDFVVDHVSLKHMEAELGEDEEMVVKCTHCKYEQTLSASMSR